MNGTSAGATPAPAGPGGATASSPSSRRVDAGHRAGRGRADHRAERDERLPEGGARPHAQRDRAHRDSSTPSGGALADWQATAAAGGARPAGQAAPRPSWRRRRWWRAATRCAAHVRGIDPAERGRGHRRWRALQASAAGARCSPASGTSCWGRTGALLGARIGDKVTLISPSGQVTPAGVVPRLKQFTLTGVFDAGHYEYDSGWR
jgi:hypothetical protein